MVAPGRRTSCRFAAAPTRTPSPVNETIELDGLRHPVKPMTAIYIKPGCRHRAIGQLRIINIPIPAFDENDEWFDP